MMRKEAVSTSEVDPALQKDKGKDRTRQKKTEESLGNQSQPTEADLKSTKGQPGNGHWSDTKMG